MVVAAERVSITEEDQLRVNWYLLFARLLGEAPSRKTLDLISSLQGDDSEIGEAIAALARAASGVSQAELQQEYFDLFIGVGGSELTPYASYYLTGFLHEKPLAKLRDDMWSLGIRRQDDLKEPEDHIASLCEMMAGLISGNFGEPQDLETQKRFFQTHIGCWAPRFFEDLEAAEAARFYMPAGTLGRLFMEIERQAFELAA